jgi:hypothetical protein
MTAAGPLVFPGSRVLAGWWQQLASFQPQAFWVAYLLVHQVEALVWKQQSQPLDRFRQLVLRALSLGEAPLPAVEERLHLSPQLLGRVLHQLEREGLACQQPSHAWRLSPLGRLAVERGEFPALRHERRRFAFLDCRRHEPIFLNLAHLPSTPCAPPEDWAFDPAVLHNCVRQSSEWKERTGFPPDVEGVAVPPGSVAAASNLPAGGEEAVDGNLPPPTPLPGPADWQRVMIDQAEQMLAVLVRRPGDEVLGFVVRPEGLLLESRQPFLQLSGAGREALPELTEEPGLAAWRQAWRQWCQPHHLPQAEIEACLLEREGLRLHIIAGKRLLDRLRVAQSEALRGEAWLLAGSGRFRSAAQLELVAAG